jgi:hypothetical protein
VTDRCALLSNRHLLASFVSSRLPVFLSARLRR